MNKNELDIPDEFSVMLLTKHTYLYEMCDLTLKKAQKNDSKLYYEIPIDEQEVTNILKTKYNIPDMDIGPCVSYLVVSGYIKMGWNDTKTIKLISFTKQGWAAATEGYFKQQHDQRQRDLVQLELNKSTIQANKNQRKINKWLIAATLVAGLVPIIVFTIDKMWFRDKPQFSPVIEIRVDSSVLNNNDVKSGSELPKPKQLLTKQPKVDTGKSGQ